MRLPVILIAVALAPRTRIGHYEIVSLLGKGGMGEVYRATDTTLGRDVAIKVLPDEFTSDPERLARFEREARVLASLDHSYIASIHGLEDIDGVRFLVMQLAEGMELSGRMKRGRLPLDEAIPIAVKIAQALEAAHERGIVHRDLKPGNVMIDANDDVKVLDFGLAKAFEVEEPDDEDYSNSPTMLRGASRAGIILGTAGYMSPEQARGKRVDKRADIWAFGVVLWEMLTGKRLFEGETLSDTIAAVLTREPDMSALPAETPAYVRWVLERCLERDPRKRLRDIGEARLALENQTLAIASLAAASQSSRIPPGHSPVQGRRLPVWLGWALSAIFLALLLGSLLADRSAGRESDAPGVVAALSIFDDEDLAIDVGSSVVVSPDGSLLAFAGIDDQGPQIYLKRMSKQGVIPIPGTRGGASPFFSPDGQWIGFFAGGMLQKVPSAGGTPIALCDATLPRGGAWSDQGMIVFTGGVASGLSIISENGGTPAPLTEVQTEKHRSHRWPQFLPGGKAVVYMAQLRGRNYDESTIEVVTLEDRVSRQVHEGGSYPRVTSSGHLLFARRGNLYALPFDTETLETSGSPQVVVHGVFSRTSNEATDDGTAHFDVSRDGMFVYREGGPVSEMSKVSVLDRTGAVIAESKPGVYATPSFSPDASRVALGVTTGSRVDIWIWDVERDTMNRLTFEGTDNVIPIWSPDGTEVAYSSMRTASKGSTAQPYVRRADGSGEERPLAPDSPMLGASGWLTSWSSDGRTIIFQSDFQSPDTWTINALDLSSGQIRRVVDSPGVDTNGETSPDGRWIAYGSTEAEMAGRPGVFVSRADGSGGRYQVSRGVGLEPRWTRNGTEIIWNGEASGFMAAEVYTSGDGLRFGEPSPMFTGRFIVQIPLRAWDVSDDGSRFVVLTPIENTDFDSKSVIVNTNWFPELERLVPGR